MEISDKLLEVLVCPESKAELLVDKDSLVSTDEKSRRRYPVKNGIPVMLIKESEVLDLEKWKEIMNSHGKL